MGTPTTGTPTFVRERSGPSGSALFPSPGEEAPPGYRAAWIPIEPTSRDKAPVNSKSTVRSPEGGAGKSNVCLLTKQRKNARKRELRKTNNVFTDELRRSLASGGTPVIKLPSNEAGIVTSGKFRWHQAVKAVAYRVLDLTIMNWAHQSKRDVKRFHEELQKEYRFVPELGKHSVEKYLKGHLRSSRAAWKQVWADTGELVKPENCTYEVWEVLVKWWPTTVAKATSDNMKDIRKKVTNLHRLGRKNLSEVIALEEVSANASHGIIGRTDCWSIKCAITKNPTSTILIRPSSALCLVVDQVCVNFGWFRVVKGRQHSWMRMGRITHHTNPRMNLIMIA